MIAAIKVRPDTLCVVETTAREGLRVLSHSYCDLVASAGDGVRQVPKSLITCQHCKDAIERKTGVPFDQA